MSSNSMTMLLKIAGTPTQSQKSLKLTKRWMNQPRIQCAKLSERRCHRIQCCRYHSSSNQTVQTLNNQNRHQLLHIIHPLPPFRALFHQSTPPPLQQIIKTTMTYLSMFKNSSIHPLNKMQIRWTLTCHLQNTSATDQNPSKSPTTTN